MGKGKFVHGPVLSGECTACHLPVAKHKFKPITNSGKLCLECHDRVDTRKVVHPPVKEGQCTRCHDPHQSPNKFQLRAAGAELCLLCHDRSIVGGKYVHGPVANGSCSTCHAAHQGDFPKLLTAQGNEVCFGCHTDKAEAFKGKKFIHAPVRGSCIMCHNPHSANYPYNLKASGTQDLCLSCHKEKEQEIATAGVKHKGLATEKRCLACHDPHASDHPKQLLKEPADLCLSCHDREYSSAAGRLVNMKELLATNKDHHGPIQEKDCSSCHNAHGSNNFRILRENFPPLFYAPYNPDNYKLCFMCHENTLASEKNTTTLTGFRNGDRNLHYVHVNKADKGRTCRACHDAHATNNPRHIRDAVPYGKWQLPVGFTKTDTGGQCLPGCHKMVRYDRKNPVQN
jgi:predicted CXXCH cytochrome family protein